MIKATINLAKNRVKFHHRKAEAIRAMRTNNNLRSEDFKKDKCHLDREVKVQFRACRILRT
jgi:hypothetical protein